MTDLKHLADRLRRRLAGGRPRASEGRSVSPPADGALTAGTSRPPDVTEYPAARRLAALTDSGRHAEALALAATELERLEQETDADPVLLRQVQMSVARAGAIGLHLRALRRRLELFPDDPSLLRQLRTQEGRWRETDTGWLPTVDPAVRSALPPRNPGREPTGRVLHLLKIGMPQRQSGYSMRSMYTLTGEARAGLDPVAVTALDFPRTVGVADAPDVDLVGGVRYVHLLRDEIPPHEAWDAYLDAYATALAPVVAAEAPDLIHVHSGNRGYEAALVALSVGRALDLPVVYEVRGFFESLWTSDTSWAEQAEIFRRRHAQEARCMREASAVVTLSESMKEDIVARGIAADRVHVVANGVDPDVFVPRERDPDLTRTLGLQDRFVFGYVSNLDHYREGQELLVDAAVELRRRGVQATALIVGDGSRRALLEAHAARVGAGDAVHFTGRVAHDEVADYYAQLDVFVIPRIDERAARLVTPLKPYEAMALSVPLVVSDLPALREITGDGQRGETFRTGQAASLADVLQRLHDDPERRRSLASTAREWVVTERDWARNGELYRAIYDSVPTPSSRR